MSSKDPTKVLPPETDAAVTDDAFLGGRLRIWQPSDGYRAGLDAVLLAAAVSSAGPWPIRVLDTGAGVGVVGLAVARRLPAANVVLVEANTTMVALAERNVARNNLIDRCSVLQRDVSQGGATFNIEPHHELLKPGTFTHILANPPFYETGAATTSPTPYKASAHAMASGMLDRWVAFMTTASVHAGELVMIHRAQALTEILAVLNGRFGDITLQPIHPRLASPANRVLVRARKGSRAPLSILPPLVLHDDAGAFRPEIEAVLRHGQALPQHQPSLRHLP